VNGLSGVTLDVAETVSDDGRVGAVFGSTPQAVLVAHGQDARGVKDKAALLWCTIHGIAAITLADRFSRDQADRLVALAGRDALAAWDIPAAAAAAAAAAHVLTMKG